MEFGAGACLRSNKGSSPVIMVTLLGLAAQKLPRERAHTVLVTHHDCCHRALAQTGGLLQINCFSISQGIMGSVYARL